MSENYTDALPGFAFPTLAEAAPLEPYNYRGTKNKRDVPAVANPWKHSPMEWAVMTRYVQGMDSEEVADSLSLSNKTVHTYSQRAREKMEQDGRVPTLSYACVQIDRFVRGVMAPKPFKVQIECFPDGSFDSRVIES